MKLKGQTGLVTGGAKRLGKRVALALGRSGANIMLHYRSSSREAEKVKAKLEEYGVDAWTLQADFQKTEQTKGLLERALTTTQRLDFLINNASIFPSANLSSMDFADIEGNLLVNTWAPFLLSRSFADNSQQGVIINLLDTRVRGFDWDHVPYYLSKVLLERLTRMTALHYAPDIRVNGVAPGLILPPEGEDQSYLENRRNRVPLRRFGDPSQIAQTVEFLLVNDFVTGQVIFIDGGRHLLQEQGG